MSHGMSTKCLGKNVLENQHRFGECEIEDILHDVISHFHPLPNQFSITIRCGFIWLQGFLKGMKLLQPGAHGHDEHLS